MGLLLYLWDLVAVQGRRRIWILFSIFLDFGFWRNASIDQEQISGDYERKGHSGGRSW